MWVSGYDVNCQYRINFNDRIRYIKEAFGFLKCMPNLDTVFSFTLAAVGKFHLPAHQLKCRYKFAYNFLRGVGLTDGEACERIWAVLNTFATRAKEMTWGHRHDFLNDVWNDLNVRRVHSTRMYEPPPHYRMLTLPAIAKDLADRLLNAVTRSQEVNTHMSTLEENFTKEEIAEMKRIEKQWQEDVTDLSKHHDLVNIYEVSVDRGRSTLRLSRRLLTLCHRAKHNGASEGCQGQARYR